jgi:hypothetical protein
MNTKRRLSTSHPTTCYPEFSFLVVHYPTTYAIIPTTVNIINAPDASPTVDTPFLCPLDELVVLKTEPVFVAVDPAPCVGDVVKVALAKVLICVCVVNPTVKICVAGAGAPLFLYDKSQSQLFFFFFLPFL